jgi:prolyl oligopeptidase
MRLFDSLPCRSSFLLQRTHAGLLNQSILFKQNGEEEKQVLLDPNAIREDGTAAIGSMSISEDAQWLAYGIAKSGSDWNEVFVRNVHTLEERPEEKLEWVCMGVA